MWFSHTKLWRAFTDGACYDGAGGWAYVLYPPRGPKVLQTGAELGTTAIRMELAAALGALRAVPLGSRLTIVTDSLTMVNIAIGRWRQDSNSDLWRDIYAEVKNRRVEWEWTEGHHLAEGNREADALAQRAMRDAVRLLARKGGQ